MPIKTITYKKTTFYQYSGSQKYVLNEIKDDDTKQMIHIHHNKHGRIWGAIAKNDILKWISKNIGLFEVVSQYPVKVYFDIDGEENETVDLEKVINIINKYFNNPKMAISGYKTETKHSYHICLYEYGIHNTEDLEEMKALVKYISNNEYQPFDWKVYTKNRNMKAINQSKPKKPIQQIIQDDKQEHHLITFYTDSIKYSMPSFSTNTPEIETIKISSKIEQTDYAELPKMELQLPDDIDLDDAYEILSIIPCDKSFAHSWTYKVALFCSKNNLTCNDFLSWYKQKYDDEEHLNKWKKYHWNNVVKNTEKYGVSIKSMLKTLQIYYPNILVNKELRVFSNTFRIINAEKVYTDYLTLKDFETDKKAIIVNIQMGGGKTHNTIKYLKQNDNFCWITPNIALSQNTFERIKNENIECVHYQHGGNLNDRKENIAGAHNLIICLNSMLYIKQTYDIIVIDEIETFLKLWFNNNTLVEDKLNNCWAKFIQLITSCKKIILLDAFISKITTDFLDNLKIDYVIINKNNETNPRQVKKYKSFDKIMNKIIHDLKNDKKCFIFYPYKKHQTRKGLPSMEDLKLMIETETGTKGTYHNADAPDSNNQQLENVNNNWINYDFVISNNKINVGINFDVSHFNAVYLMIAGFNSPRDLAQFSYRPRDLKDNIIYYCFIDTYNPVSDVLKTIVSTENDIYQKLFKNVLIEKRSPVEETFVFFLGLAHYEIIEDYEEVISDKKLVFDNMDYYNYDNLKDLNSDEADNLIKKVCRLEADITDKLNIRRFFYSMNFKDDTPYDVKCDIWNNNKIEFMNNCLNVLYKNDVISKLKQNYKWELYFPEEIKNTFKFDKNDLDLCFNQVDFKYLNKDKSTHNLILKNYINTIYGVDILVKTRDKMKYKVNDTLKDVYINIVEHHNEDMFRKINGCMINIENENYAECL